MAEVLRLDVNAKGGIDPGPDGAYVLYSDYAAERERSRKLRRTLAAYADGWEDDGEIAREALAETEEGERE